jgi:hypothetical protein
VGGFALTAHATLAREPRLAAGYAHLVVLDPPPHEHVAAAPGPVVHLVHGAPEAAFALAVHEHEHDLRPAVAALYRALRDAGGASGEGLTVRCAARARVRPSGRAGPCACCGSSGWSA